MPDAASPSSSFRDFLQKILELSQDTESPADEKLSAIEALVSKALSRTKLENIDLCDPDMTASQIRLHMGEMTAQEVRTARAAIRMANAKVGDVLFGVDRYRLDRHTRREAFAAGWRTNAVAETTDNQSYLEGCENADWTEFQRRGLDQYLTDLRTAAEEEAAAQAGFAA